MTQTAIDTSRDSGLTYREYEPDDFPGLQHIWQEAGWGELSAEMFDYWCNHNPEGLIIPVVALDETGRVVGLITMLPHRIAVGDRVVQGGRFMANIVSNEFKGRFDIATHPIMGLWAGCREAAVRRGYPVIFSLPKSGWLAILRKAAASGMKEIPHKRIGCMERPVASPPALIGGMTARPVAELTADHAQLWQQARKNQDIGCAIHRDLATLSYRNSEHRNFELVTASGTLAGYATVRKDGLLYDIVTLERDLYDPALAALLNALDSSIIPDLKLMMMPYYEDPAALGFVNSIYKFGFAVEALDETLTDEFAVDSWYLAGGG
ncbi:hypothetical protein [Croceicoccus mobilis]|uniref:Uncharacterized protein n=1 Tax=Croceicoccus mobilis TaxID=1703339 RepID=A0A916YYF4_9SPHN|nr:hypothetical protein [Croceicoccus mobilis]GGD65774.1 hypothetical protein GCM10010990_14060 [Croceicoccus mobilis]